MTRSGWHAATHRGETPADLLLTHNHVYLNMWPLFMVTIEMADGGIDSCEGRQEVHLGIDLNPVLASAAVH